MQQGSFTPEEANAFYKTLHQHVEHEGEEPHTLVLKTRQVQKAALELEEQKLALKRQYEEDKKKLRAQYQNSLRDLQRVSRFIQNDRTTQLDRLDEKVRALTEWHAREALYQRAYGSPQPGDTTERREIYRAWWWNTRSGKDDPRAYEHAAKECGIEYTVTLIREDLAYILGYSLAGVDKLRKRGALPFQRSGYRTLWFLPKDVEHFIKHGRKWSHNMGTKQNL